MTLNSMTAAKNSTKAYNKSLLSSPRFIIMRGDASFNGSEFINSGDIVATGNVTFNFFNIRSGEDKDVVICSESSNVTIIGSKAAFKGVIYAPEGTVIINTTDFSIELNFPTAFIGSLPLT
jgi:uncharacterized Zn-binding protein involved in type VI secretion